jgi:hypothetical protein
MLCFSLGSVAAADVERLLEYKLGAKRTLIGLLMAVNLVVASDNV